MTHYKTLCRHCYKIMGQCRCASKDKEIRYDTCDACQGKVKYKCDRKVYLITKEGESEPYPFIGSHEEFLDYYKWFGENNRIAMSRLSFTSIHVAEIDHG